MNSEPHKIKSVRRLHIKNFQERKAILMEAGYNTFRIPSNNVTYELSSQGTSVRSQEQESKIFLGDEAYVGSRNFEYLTKVVNEIFGHTYVCPTHNLQGSHKLVTTTMVMKGELVIANSDLVELWYMIEE